MSLTKKEQKAINDCIMAIAKKVPRTMVDAKRLKSNQEGRLMAISLGATISELNKMVAKLKAN
jgi:hypothetical protein